jgi:hypothetical protein
MIRELGYGYTHVRMYPCGLFWADNGRGTDGRWFITTLVRVSENEYREGLAAGDQVGRMKKYKTLEMME